jgi:outer membrane immunogenic protein
MSAAVLFAVSTVPALAADVGGFGAAGDWNGVYFGINGGGGWATATNNYGASMDSAPPIKSGGWLAGGQLGYNWQYANNAVVGLEASADYAALSGTSTATFDPGGGGGPVNATNKQTLDELGQFRAKVGFAAGPVMPYISGGVAFGRGTLSVSGGPTATGSASKTFTGWTAGGGAEIALGEHWSLRADYSYVDLGTQNFTVPGPGGGTNVHLTANIVTGGLNLRW